MTGLAIGLGIAFVVTWAVCMVIETERGRLAVRVALLERPEQWMRAGEVAERSGLALGTTYAALRRCEDRGHVDTQAIPGGPERGGRPAYVYRARVGAR